MSAVRELYMGVVQAGIARHPRSLQKAIGPSEIGDPCDRAIIRKLSGTYPDDMAPAWKPAVGTAVHAQLEQWFDAADADPATGELRGEWVTETRVRVGTLVTEKDGDRFEQPITGTSDLFHVPSGTVVDHKCVGPKSLKKYTEHGPSETYHVQAQLYGLGFRNAGYDVREVAISFLPRDGELQQAYWWSEPYDELVATRALQRLDSLNRLATNLGPDVACSLFELCDDPWCRSCRADRAAAKAADRPNLFA